MANTDSFYSLAKTAVFWDLEDCPVPDGLNPRVISQNIRTSLGNAGYNGELSITAYANESSQVPEEDFVSAGIDLVHVPEGGKGKDCSREFYRTSDMTIGWFVKNGREQGNVMMITKYASDIILPKMKRHGFNLLLALPDNGPQETRVRDVTSVWYWGSLSAGGKPIENVATCSCCGRFQGDADADAPEAAECDH